jgi:hypothetical protein
MIRRRHLLPVALLAFAILLAASSPLVAAATNGTYGGKTAQGFKITARVAGSRVYLIRVKVKLRCHDGGLLYDDLSDFEATPLSSSSTFTDAQFGPSDEVRWQGRLKAGKVRGSLRVNDKVSGGVRCDSGTVDFAIRRSSRSPDPRPGRGGAARPRSRAASARRRPSPRLRNKRTGPPTHPAGAGAVHFAIRGAGR